LITGGNIDDDLFKYILSSESGDLLGKGHDSL